jgi:hypothetical protein
MKASLRYSVAGYFVSIIGVILMILGAYVAVFIGIGGNLALILFVSGLFTFMYGLKLISASSIIVDNPPPEPTQSVFANNVQDIIEGISNKLSIKDKTHFVVKDESAHLDTLPKAALLATSRIYAAQSYRPVTSNYIVMDKDKNEFFSFKVSINSAVPNSAVLSTLPYEITNELGRPIVYIVDKVGNTVGEIMRLNTVDENNKSIIVDTLVDTNKVPLIRFKIRRGTIHADTLEASWYGGMPFLTTSTSEITENLDIKEVDGKIVAKVHTHQFAIHDTYEVTILGNVNPLIPLVIAHIFRP